MEAINFVRQTADKPLYPELFWSRPENKLYAGKLLIIGGNSFGFSAPAQAYNGALEAGIGEVRAVVPDAIHKIVKGFFEHAVFTPSTPSGSFSKKGIPELLQAAQWADGVILPGDVGKNAETTIAIEEFMRSHKGLIVATKDVVSSLQAHPATLLDRKDTTLVVTVEQLQKLAIATHYDKAFTFDTPHQKLIDRLSEFTTKHACSIILKRRDQVFVAFSGLVSMTTVKNDSKVWRVDTAARVAVWAIQHPQKLFESLTSAVFDVFGDTAHIPE